MNLKAVIAATLILFLFSCNEKTNKKLLKKSVMAKLDERYAVVGDFNGDKIDDTIFESYQNSITKKEINKIHDSINWENDIELTVKINPFQFYIQAISQFIN